eukprot:scaffold252990_cov63-Attheya_sp.AAC.4
MEDARDCVYTRVQTAILISNKYRKMIPKLISSIFFSYLEDINASVSTHSLRSNSLNASASFTVTVCQLNLMLSNEFIHRGLALLNKFAVREFVVISHPILTVVFLPFLTKVRFLSLLFFTLLTTSNLSWSTDIVGSQGTVHTTSSAGFGTMPNFCGLPVAAEIPRATSNKR